MKPVEDDLRFDDEEFNPAVEPKKAKANVAPTKAAAKPVAAKKPAPKKKA